MAEKSITRWRGLSEEPELINELEQLSEGSNLPVEFEESDTHVFLKVDRKGHGSAIYFLTESGRGEMAPFPIIEEYRLQDIESYRENGVSSGDRIEFVSIKGASGGFPKCKRTDPIGTSDFQRYTKMLDTLTEAVL
jgi:hypothetical protein